MNKSPDASNYNKLKEFYGSVGGRRRNLRASDKTTSTGTMMVEFKNEDEVTSIHSDAPLWDSTTPSSFEMSEELFRQKMTAEPPVVTEIPPHIMHKRKTVLDQFESLIYKHGIDSSLLERYGWKVVEQSLWDVEHMIDLGDGYMLEVQISAP